MKILRYVEKAWIISAVVSAIVGLYNLITLQKVNNLVYFPLFCALFCVLIWFNIRGQRKFREKVFGKTEDSKTIEKK